MRPFSRSAFLAATASVALARPARAQTLTPLRVGSVPIDSFAEAYYGRDSGIFERAGLDVQIVPFTNGAGSTTAIAGGALDLGISTVTMMANAALHGLPLVYIAGGALFDDTATTALLVGKNSPITDPKDFVGKTVAVSGIKDGTHLPLVVWLIKNGVDPDKVAVIEMPFSAMVPAITRGTIAGAVVAEPFITVGAADTRIVTLVHAALAKHFMTGGWFTTPDWIKANAPLAKRFVAAIYETARWANANHAATGAILEKYAKIDATVIAKMTRTTFATSLTPDLLDPSLDWAARVKFTERRVMPNEMIASL